MYHCLGKMLFPYNKVFAYKLIYIYLEQKRLGETLHLPVLHIVTLTVTVLNGIALYSVFCNDLQMVNALKICNFFLNH